MSRSYPTTLSRGWGGWTCHDNHCILSTQERIFEKAEKADPKGLKHDHSWGVRIPDRQAVFWPPLPASLQTPWGWGEQPGNEGTPNCCDHFPGPCSCQGSKQGSLVFTWVCPLNPLISTIGSKGPPSVLHYECTQQGKKLQQPYYSCA